MTPVTTETSFSDELRNATGRSHGDAQHSTFMTALFRGELEPARYANLVAQYFYIYGAIEERAHALANDPVAGAFIDARLNRIDAIEADLRHFLGLGWRSEIKPLVVTLEYVTRILDATPEQFVAHHYVRYLGDLSGGQHIARVIQKHFALEGSGLAFYDFAELGDPDAFKQAYRASLDAAGFSPESRAAVIEEALAAYDLNTRVLQDL